MIRTTLAELAAMMARPTEDNWLEFKKAETRYDTTKLFKRCVAIANEGGGKILFGITNSPPRQVVGSQALPNRAKIEADIFNKLKFRVIVEELDPPHPDGRVLVFHVPSRPKGTAFQFEGAYLMRVGEETPTMSEDRLREIFNEGQPEWLQEIAAKDCSADDVVRLLDTQCYFDLLAIPYPSERSGVLERFHSEGFIFDRNGTWDISNLGVIAFAKNLGNFKEKSSGIDKVVTAAEAFQLPAPDFRVGEVHTSVVMFAYKEFDDMDKKDRIRACYQHCCLKYVMNEKMTNQTLRNRFQLSDKKTETISRVLKHTVKAGLIKLGDPNAASTRYRDYLPFWA